MTNLVNYVPHALCMILCIVQWPWLSCMRSCAPYNALFLLFPTILAPNRTGVETWREGPRIGKHGQSGCLRPAVWKNTEEEKQNRIAVSNKISISECTTAYVTSIPVGPCIVVSRSEAKQSYDGHGLNTVVPRCHAFHVYICSTQLCSMWLCARKAISPKGRRKGRQ